MSQRLSGYERRKNDDYATPEWVTMALMPHLPKNILILEPAPGACKMVNALLKAGHKVSFYGKDYDYLTDECERSPSPIAVVTNPPYKLAQLFIEKALRDTNRYAAMLLRTDYDHAQSRQHLFRDCPFFAKKLVLIKRIVWFKRPGAAPSFNHAWFIWDKQHIGPPVLAYTGDNHGIEPQADVGEVGNRRSRSQRTRLSANPAASDVQR